MEYIRSLYSGLKKMNGLDKSKSSSHMALELAPGGHCSLRAFFIGNHQGESNSTHIMVMIEKITQKHRLNLNKAQVDFNLTKREIDVLKLICDGFTNKEISEVLFISEYTVKDHIKNIMRKMKAASRNEIMAAIE